ncbi:MAG: YihY family inner membrane protein, partial [Moraxellaceae bacterium]
MPIAGLKQHIQRTRLGWIFDLCVQFYRDYHTSGCQDQAAALTYMTLFALVPLMAVSYAVFSMVPEFAGVAGQVEKFLFSHFVPESTLVIQSYLSSFYLQAQKLTWIGVLFLGVTAFLMLGDIERTFNRIWGVRRGRRGLNKFLLYWAVLSIGPLLIGSAFAISTYVISSKYWLWGGSAIWSPFVAVFPAVLTATAFSLLFIAVPNCSVPIKYGVIGGIASALGFELLKFFFGLAVTNANFKFIYGAFAALPLFLL